MILLTHGNGKRIHNPTAHANIFILCKSCKQCQIDHAQIFDLHQVSDDQSGHHFQRSRRANPQTFWNISIIQQIHSAGHWHPFLHQCTDHSLWIIGPSMFPLPVQLPHGQLQDSLIRIIQRTKTKPVVCPFSYKCIGSHGDRTGKYMTSIIIGMFPDQIYPAGCKIDARHCTVPINLLKFVHKLLFHCTLLTACFVYGRIISYFVTFVNMPIALTFSS